MSRDERRKVRLRSLLSTIISSVQSGYKVDKERLIANCCFEWGVSRRTCLEYLKILELTDKIIIDGNQILDKQEDKDATTTAS